MHTNGDGCVLAGSLSEEGLLLYLRALQTLLPLLPVSESSNRPEVGSDSEDEDDTGIHPPPMQVRHMYKHVRLYEIITTLVFVVLINQAHKCGIRDAMTQSGLVPIRIH